MTAIDDDGSYCKREYLLQLMESEPARISYERTIRSAPGFLKIILDGTFSGLAKCSKCENPVYICSYSRATGNKTMKRHDKRVHPHDRDRNPLSENESEDAGVKPEKGKGKLYASKSEEKIQMALKELEKEDLDASKKALACFRVSGKKSVRGRDLWKCLFCTFIGIRNSSRLKSHILHICPGVPVSLREEIRSNSKLDYKYHVTRQMKYVPIGPTKVKKTLNEYESPSDVDTDENYEQAMEETNNPLDDTSRAVQILTRLLDDRERQESIDERSDHARKKKPLDLCSNDELEREIKELTVKKMRREIEEMDQRRSQQTLIEKEREERLRFFSNVNNEFGTLISAMKKFIKGKGEGSVISRKGEGSSTGKSVEINGTFLLEQAYCEAVNGT